MAMIIRMFGVVVVGGLTIFLGLSNAQAECTDDDGDDPYVLSSTASSGTDLSMLDVLNEHCESDGTMYALNEIYCENDEVQPKTYFCDSCDSPTVCVAGSEATVTDTWSDSDGGGSSERMIKGTILRYTEVSYSGGIISSGTYTTALTDQCKAGSPGKIKEYRVIANVVSSKWMYCPKDTTCTSGACQ